MILTGQDPLDRGIRSDHALSLGRTPGVQRGIGVWVGVNGSGQGLVGDPLGKSDGHPVGPHGSRDDVAHGTTQTEDGEVQSGDNSDV